MNKTKIRFFTIADFEEEEIWLREQHRAGLRLVRTVVPCFYIFEECTPEDVIYRLDFQNNEEDSDYMQLFRDYGWECFNRCVGWLYFRKPASQVAAEDEGEIFSDGASKVAMLEHILKTRMLPLLVVFLCCVVPNCIRFATDGLTFFGVFCPVMALLYLYLFLHCGTKIRRLKQKYEANG